MCTLVLLRRPGHPAWPLVLAANRDELRSRPAAPPARHWPDRPHVVAGLDRLGGGTWLGVNDDGLAAAVLNRRGSLGPEPGKRSRGELVLDALDHAEAYIAADALAALDPAAYRPFNLVVADAIDAFLLTHRGDGAIRSRPIPEGLSLLEAGELNDPGMARTRRYLPLFRGAEAPDPGRDEWSAWVTLLADRTSASGDPRDAMCIVTDGEYGTVSSTLLALPPFANQRPAWFFADGRPGEAAWERVEVGGGA
jgi:hypothetical protein